MADSIVIIVLTFGIMLFGASYLALSHAENMPIASMNAQIDSGVLTADTVNNYNIILGFWKTLPLFFCLGLILWMYERAKGSDIAASTFFEYEVLMIVSVFISMLLAWVWGLSIDSIFGSLDAQPLTSNVSPVFDRSSVIAICIKMAYLGTLIPGAVGSLLYIIHPIIRQADNTFFEFQEDKRDSEESVTPFQLQQF
ncbi:MAG: hypothetical protein LLG05_14415 [Porphyromonadaceae bacterium]|nr:hypothetical protein [Porphyromonadaceae bacterium]